MVDKFQQELLRSIKSIADSLNKIEKHLNKLENNVSIKEKGYFQNFDGKGIPISKELVESLNQKKEG